MESIEMTAQTSTKRKKSRSDKKMPGDNTLLTKGAQAKARIISVAETLFNKQGFDGASMRDIAAAAEMQPASVYYYFESKEELLWAVWEKGGVELLDRVRNAIADKTDPWQRMETACVAHTTGLLDWRRANQALFVMPPWHYPESIKARVIALRDEYERIFTGLIDDLPLRKGVDRRYLRLSLIGALSWSLFWFKKERDAPAAIARQMLQMLRAGVDETK
jgi:AcrR family transcriptional regulator